MLQAHSNIQMQAIFNLIYPEGSVYFSTTLDTVAKVQNAFGGTWEKLPDGYAIWTVSSGAGDTIAAGLPDINGEFFGMNGSLTTASGVFTGTTKSEGQYGGGATSGEKKVRLKFNASNSNSIYGNSTTVQPPAYKVYAFKRTALSGDLKEV